MDDPASEPLDKSEGVNPRNPFIRGYLSTDREDTANICHKTVNPALAASGAATHMAPYVWTHPFTHLSPEHCFVLDDGSGTAVGYVVGTPDLDLFARKYPAYVSEVLDPQLHDDGDDKRLLKYPVPQMATPEPFMFKVSEGVEGDPALATSSAASREVVNPAWLLQAARCPPPGMTNDIKDLVKKYNATMHINLLEPFRGKGWGRKMIDTFAQSVKDVANKEVKITVSDDGGATMTEKEFIVWCAQGIHIGVAGDNAKVVPFYERCGFKRYQSEDEQDGQTIWMCRDL